ncbi:MAG TPA: ATP-binding protein, partial [Polyangiaceae bacterium]|nr:ATP-binding protein [Polyangiaceae bacterium]
VEAARPTAEAKGVTLTVNIGPVGTIHADAERLQQVVGNVLSNAVKFTPKGGHIDLSAQRDEGPNPHVVIQIRDTGEGIVAEFLPFLFDPFRQADGSTTRRHGGLGLGLAIVKQLVFAHGGTVTAESDGENRGATFTIRIPVGPSASPPANAPTLPPESNRTATRLDGLRLLAVDDQEDARHLLREILSERGAKVACAASANEALERIADFRPHVLVSDLAMPGQDGLDLIQRVRRLPPERGGLTPAIALTAYAHADDTQRAMAAGFQMHVAKPVDPVSLAVAVAYLARTTASIDLAEKPHRTT